MERMIQREKDFISTGSRNFVNHCGLIDHIHSLSVKRLWLITSHHHSLEERKSPCCLHPWKNMCYTANRQWGEM